MNINDILAASAIADANDSDTSESGDETNIRLISSGEDNVFVSTKYYTTSRKARHGNRYKGIDIVNAQLLINEASPRANECKLVVTTPDGEQHRLTGTAVPEGKRAKRLTHKLPDDLVVYFNDDDIVVKRRELPKVDTSIFKF